MICFRPHWPPCSWWTCLLSRHSGVWQPSVTATFPATTVQAWRPSSWMETFSSGSSRGLLPGYTGIWRAKEWSRYCTWQSGSYASSQEPFLGLLSWGSGTCSSVKESRFSSGSLWCSSRMRYQGKSEGNVPVCTRLWMFWNIYLRWENILTQKISMYLTKYQILGDCQWRVSDTGNIATGHQWGGYGEGTQVWHLAVENI